MDIADHDEHERKTIGTLRGTVIRHAMALANGGGDQAAGVAQLRDITTDPHLLAHGVAGGAWYCAAARELLLAAGADPSELGMTG